MKKRFLYQVMLFSILLCAMSLIIVPSASAHQTANYPKHSLTPNASGGGCSQGISNGTNDIQNLKACISYSYPYLRPDSYVTFRHLTNHGGVSSCGITINLADFNTDSKISQQTYNCALDAINNATNKHYGPFSYAELSGSYYSFAYVVINYSDGYKTTNISNDSPVQNVP